ncbi:MAG: hypothetical protein ACKPBG_11980 [Actinomycetota bacterium]
MLAAATSAPLPFPILSALVLAPLVGSVLTVIGSNRRPEITKLIALLSSAFTGALGLWLLASFETGDEGFQFVSRHEWISSWGIGWHLGVDGISLFLVVLTGVLFPLVIAGCDPHHGEKRQPSARRAGSTTGNFFFE